MCGAQLRYLVRSPSGWLGGLSFSAAAWRPAARDRWIGWGEEARTENLALVIGNSRFLILPTVTVPHLASHVLGLACRRLAGDWQTRYGYRPALVETFVEKERFAGTCYRAANWLFLGETNGRGRQDSTCAKAKLVKDIYVYPLRPDVREALGGKKPEASTVSGDWADEEFGSVNLGDARLAQACPKTTVVSVGDREADMYELFAAARRNEHDPHLLIRSQHNRRLTGRDKYLWNHLDRQPQAGIQELLVPQRKNRPERLARLGIRFAKVELKAPPNVTARTSVSIWAVLATEVEPPPEVEPLRGCCSQRSKSQALTQRARSLSGTPNAGG